MSNRELINIISRDAQMSIPKAYRALKAFKSAIDKFADRNGDSGARSQRDIETMNMKIIMTIANVAKISRAKARTVLALFSAAEL